MLLIPNLLALNKIVIITSCITTCNLNTLCKSFTVTLQLVVPLIVLDQSKTRYFLFLQFPSSCFYPFDANCNRAPKFPLVDLVIALLETRCRPHDSQTLKVFVSILFVKDLICFEKTRPLAIVVGSICKSVRSAMNCPLFVRPWFDL